MSLSLLLTIVGILGGLLTLLVIFSLLRMAQKGDAYLEQMGLGEGRDWSENSSKGAREALEEPMRAAGGGPGS